ILLEVAPQYMAPSLVQNLDGLFTQVYMTCPDNSVMENIGKIIKFACLHMKNDLVPHLKALTEYLANAFMATQAPSLLYASQSLVREFSTDSANVLLDSYMGRIHGKVMSCNIHNVLVEDYCHLV